MRFSHPDAVDSHVSAVDGHPETPTMPPYTTMPSRAPSQTIPMFSRPRAPSGRGPVDAVALTHPVLPL